MCRPRLRCRPREPWGTGRATRPRRGRQGAARGGRLPPPRWSAGRRGSSWRAGSRVGSRQSEQKTGAPRSGGLKLERAAHQLGQVAREGGPEAEPAAPPVSRTCGGLDLEEARGGAGLDAAARVLDLEGGMVAVVPGGDADRAAGRRRIDGVLEQVLEDLLEPVGVGL